MDEAKYRPEQFRPCGYYTFVKLDPLSEKIGDLLWRPGDAYGADDIKAWATVVSVGPGIWSKKIGHLPVGVKPGDRVYVIRVHEKVATQQEVQHLFGKGYMVLKPSDLMMVEVKEETHEEEDRTEVASDR
jgi:co-chaperonin GroES (HSP10)